MVSNNFRIWYLPVVAVGLFTTRVTVAMAQDHTRTPGNGDNWVSN